MKYLTRNNMGEVAQMTGLPLEEVEAFLSYHEEAGNHHAPIPRRTICDTSARTPRTLEPAASSRTRTDPTVTPTA